jgi:hypothetical protein
MSIETTLLALLTTRQRVPADACAAWTEEDWARALAMLAQHRLEPMLHWRLAHERAHVGVPDGVREQLKAAFAKATLRWLAIQGDLVKVHRLMADAGVAHIVLKGPFLAQHAYPHPALRPMRDLDVLVPQPEALFVFDLLVAGGCRRSPRFPGDPASFLEGRKHLPPVLAPSGRLLIELHARLTKRSEADQAAAALLDEQAIWQRRVNLPLAGSALDFMAPTDLLLHMIVHAAYEHRFDNGPLVLSDIAYLVERHAIDWPLLRAMAERGRWLRGARLLLRMTAAAFDLPALERGAHALGEDADEADLDTLVQTAALLTLRDISVETDQKLLGAVDAASNWRSKARLLLDKAFPPRRSIASQFAFDPRSPAILFGYVLKWRFLARRSLELRRTLRGQSKARRLERQEERRRVEALDRWLHHEPG